MKKIFNLVKASLLLAVLAILASSALPGSARANENAVAAGCAGTGEECHFVAHDVLYHGKNQAN